MEGLFVKPENQNAIRAQWEKYVHPHGFMQRQTYQMGNYGKRMGKNSQTCSLPFKDVG